METLFLPRFLILSREEQKATLEALIFSSEETVTSDMLFNLLITNDKYYKSKHPKQNDIDDEELTENIPQNITPAYFDELILEINNDLVTTNRPFSIVKFAGGYQYSTRNEYGELINQFVKSKTKRRLSQATLEVLSIVAYKQPISKPEIEAIRGVNSNEIVNSLIDRNLIKIAGRSESLGKPLLYATTQEFLRVFGLNSLQDLPKLTELEELAESSAFLPEPESVITINVMENEDMEVIKENNFSTFEISEDNEIPKIKIKNITA